MSQGQSQAHDSTNHSEETATLGGGCFWCLEPMFDNLKGVKSVESGYSGGSVVNPTYSQVCTGTTGHAEVIQITFDPGQVSFEEILQVFFSIHDPTTHNRQGADVGPQYRSTIFHHSEAQRQTAQRVIRELEAAKIWNSPIVTEVAPFSTFYVAENYHQEYYERNSGQLYCRVVIAPKMAKFRKNYSAKLKSAAGAPT